VEVNLHSLLTSILDTCCQLHATATLLPEKYLPVPTALDVGSAPDPVWTLWKRYGSLIPTGTRKSRMYQLSRTYDAGSMCCLFVGNLAELMYNICRRYQSPQISVTGRYATGTLNIISYHHHYHHHLSLQSFVGFRLFSQVSPNSSILSCFLPVF